MSEGGAPAAATATVATGSTTAPPGSSSSTGLCFHSRCGHLVSLSPCLRSAVRSHASQEFNHGVVLSERPLQDNQIFEVRIDKKIHSWSGSIEVGVTTCDPDAMDSPFPSSATEFRRGSWIMSGNSVLRDGRSINENYGTDLDKLEEGDRVGVLKTSNGDLIFFVNGVSQSVAASGLPERVFAVVDLYGKCAGVTVMDNSSQEARILSNAITNEATAAAACHNSVNMISSNSAHNNMTNTNIAATNAATAATAAAIASSTTPPPSSFNNNKIRFHERKGALIKLSNNHRTAERRRPYDEFNNGVVMTHRPLRDNELFEIRIDRLVDKWSGSIEVGITTHNPGVLDFPATMTNAKSGTMMMSGCGILTNGRGTRREYGEFNLDDLNEGDRIGMMRKGNGNIHFYINGLDQGVAATKVPQQMWGVVDLYGMTVKVTIVDRDERDEQNLITRRNVAMREHFTEENRLLFHRNCGSHAAVINGGLSAHRPNASDDFNFGVVLTNRPLKTNEVFEVRLDKMVAKWAGSIEIGVTTHSPSDLEFPSTMTNIRSGTWMMTGNGVMHNGTTVFDDYGQNLDKLKVGDRVAVVRKENGTLHFFVNSEDQGPAATNVPDCVYGVIDLYGQAAQASIIDLSDYRSPGDGPDSEATSATLYSQLETSDLRFHHLHGRNARISNSGLTASRPNALGEFNDAIVITNRPLKDGEHFEIVIERMVERWSGSIEAGVTLIRPEDLEFPNTMTDIDYDTWMLSGSAVMRDGQTVRNGYCCDLDTLSVGSRLGMLRTADGSLHYTINGEDQGVACESIPPFVYAVVDLYGQCAQVSIVHAPLLQQLLPAENSLASSQALDSSHLSLPPACYSAEAATTSSVPHRFNASACAKGLTLRHNGHTCMRSNSEGGGVVFANSPIDDHFEIRVDELGAQWAGSLRLGVTSGGTEDLSTMTSLPPVTTWLEDTDVFQDGRIIRKNYSPSLERLRVGDRLGVRRTSDACLRFSLNGEDLGLAASNMGNKKFIPVVELCGSISAITITSISHHHHLALSPMGQSAQAMQDSLEVLLEEKDDATSATTRGSAMMPVEFHENHGRNITLCGLTAKRHESYNQGLVATNRPLRREEPFEVFIGRLNPKWSSSLMVGVISQSPDKMRFPVSALGWKKNSIVVSSDVIYRNGAKVASGLSGINLDDLRAGQSVGVMINQQNKMSLLVDGIDRGVVFEEELPRDCYAFVDLYGQCEEVTLVNTRNDQRSGDAEEDEKAQVKDSEGDTVGAAASLMPGPLSHGLVRHCDYLEACRRFKSSLCLPARFFASPSLLPAVCFCLFCHRARGDPAYFRKGDPPRDFSAPLGWCQFPFKSAEQTNSPTNDWHTAFHPSRPAVLRRVLDSGELVHPGYIGLEQRCARPRPKEDDSDAPQLLFSPTLKYVSNLCPESSFRDRYSKTTQAAKVALLIEIHPGSYKVGAPTAGVTAPIDAHFKLEETEWLSKERGNTAIAALLVHLRQV